MCVCKYAGSGWEGSGDDERIRCPTTNQIAFPTSTNNRLKKHRNKHNTTHKATIRAH